MTKRKKPVKAAEDSLSIFPLLRQEEDQITDTLMSEFTAASLKEYGSYVVEDRAVVDYRDGLKPVHRALLWSLAGLGLRPTSGYKKAARTVGDTIGKYHPHGDAACYGAMVTIANTLPPAVDGQGNWGSPIAPAAAQRYTEARMSKFAHLFLLDKDYLQVVPKTPNFSNDDEIPLFMPALLPYALFNGSIPAPAYGVRAGNPTFSFRSVSKVVIALLNGKKLSSAKIAKTLEVVHPWGCDVVVDDDFEDMIETGKGSIAYAPLVEEDYDKKQIRIRSFVPTTLSSYSQIDKTLEKISQVPGVRKCFSKQGKKSKGSGPYGALFIIECQRNLDTDTFYDALEAIEKITTSSVSYRLGITVRKEKSGNTFSYLGYTKFLHAWAKYRIQLELRMIAHKLEAARKERHLQGVYLYAVENMERLLKALPKTLTSKNPDATLAKLMKMDEADATIILNRQVRKLAKLEANDLKAKIKALDEEIAELEKDEKAPGKRAARDTKARVKQYIKNPDIHKSGVDI